MTEVSFHGPRNQFALVAQPDLQRYALNAPPAFVSPPRCAVHSNETFVPRGTSQADVAALFLSREHN